MNQFELPDQWKVNIEEVDKQHQELLSLFQQEAKKNQHNNFGKWLDFNNFYKQLLNLMNHQENIIATSGSSYLQPFQKSHKHSRKTLKELDSQNSPLLKDTCYQILLIMISQAEIYHNIYKPIETSRKI